MNINAREEIKEDDQGVNGFFESVDVESYKSTDVVSLKQGDNEIVMSEYQIMKLRKLFINIFD